MVYPGWYASLLHPGGMPPYYTLGVYLLLYTLGTPIPLMHLGPAHPAAHAGRLRDDEALGSNLGIIRETCGKESLLSPKVLRLEGG